MKSSKLFQAIFMTFGGTISSILIGLFFYNTSIFNPKIAVFQFVINGLLGAIFFSLLKLYKTKAQIFGIVIFLLLDFAIILGKSISLALIIRDVLFLGSLFLSIKFYFQFIKTNYNLIYYLRGFAQAFFYAFTTIALGAVVFLLNTKFELPPLGYLLSIGKNALLIGFGIGIGLDVCLQNEVKIMRLIKSKIV